MLLAESEDTLQGEYEVASEALNRHEALEAKRMRARLPSDLDRWAEGGEVRDL